MPKKPGYLERLCVPSPCPTDWASMSGDGRKRYCSECDKHVYNLSKMSRAQSEALVARMQGRLCARIERGPDGLIITEEGSTPLRLISRRASPVASAVVATMLGVGGSIVQASNGNNPVAPHSLVARAAISGMPRLTDTPASIEGTVNDSAGAVVAMTTITLTCQATGLSSTTSSSDEGRFSFDALEPGGYSLTVESPGFVTTTVTDITLYPAARLEVNVTLQVEETTSVSVGGAVAVQSATLRTLYEESQLIVTARVGRSIQVEKDKESGNMLMRTALDISSIIKGKSRKSRVYVYYWGWGKKREFPGGFQEGDELLVFLSPQENGKGYELSDPHNGAKKLSKDELEVYLERIKVLAGILEQDAPQIDEIIEWLVRCAETPATRWEGAYELASNSLASLEKYGAASCKKESAVDEINEPVAVANKDAEANKNSAGDEAESSDRALSEQLNAQQKERLVQALLSTRQIATRDYKLIELVKALKDERLFPFLVSQLRLIQDDPTENAAGLIFYVNDLMNDEEISDLLTEYLQLSHDEDEDEQEEGGDAPARDPATLKRRQSAILQKVLTAVEKNMLARAQAN